MGHFAGAVADRVGDARPASRPWPRGPSLALDIGFQDQSYFTKVFKRYRKVAPLQYRKRVASGQ